MPHWDEIQEAWAKADVESAPFMEEIQRMLDQMGSIEIG